jgi:hypothetical protein
MSLTPDVRIRNARWLQGLMLDAATVYFARKLGFRKRVRVTIELVKGLQKREHCRAMAHQNSRHGYYIKIDHMLKPLAMLGCLAHEMIHVRQWLTGKMEDLQRRYLVRWGKRIYVQNKIRYKDHPWEREAYRYDTRLAQSFVDFWTSGWRR